MKRKRATVAIAVVVVLTAILGGSAVKVLLHRGAAPAQSAATPKPVFAIYYLWWTTLHWHDLLGPSYPYAKSPSPLPARLDANDKATSLYSGNRLTDVSQKLAYDQNRPSVIEADVRAAAAHGISGFSVNWKGAGTTSQTPTSTTFNKRLQVLFDVVKKVNAAGVPFKVQLNYQASAQLLTTTWIVNDLNYYVHRYGAAASQDHSFSAKPTVIWVGSWKYPDATVTSVSKVIRSKVYLMGDEGQTKWDANAAANFDGDTYYWSSQDPYRNPRSFSQISNLAARVRATKNPDGSTKTWLAPFTPGFNAALRYGSGRAVPRKRGATMRKLYDGNQASNPDGWTFISWNEISEGTYIVPLTRFGDYYLKQIASVIGSTAAPAARGS